MRRGAGLLIVLLASGCGTAPIADFMDWVAPSHVGPQMPVAPVASPPPVKPVEPLPVRTPISSTGEAPSAPTVGGTTLPPDISGLR